MRFEISEDVTEREPEDNENEHELRRDLLRTVEREVSEGGPESRDGQAQEAWCVREQIDQGVLGDYRKEATRSRAG